MISQCIAFIYLKLHLFIYSIFFLYWFYYFKSNIVNCNTNLLMWDCFNTYLINISLQIITFLAINLFSFYSFSLNWYWAPYSVAFYLPFYSLLSFSILFSSHSHLISNIPLTVMLNFCRKPPFCVNRRQNLYLIT